MALDVVIVSKYIFLLVRLDSKLFCFLQILHFISILSDLYFREKLPVTLSYAQASVLLCIGLQMQDISYIEVWFLALHLMVY